MDMGIKEIEVEIQKLELNERASLAKWIVESLDELTQAEADALWAEEAECRLDEWSKVLSLRYRIKKFFVERGLLYHESDRIFILALTHQKRRAFYW